MDVNKKKTHSNTFGEAPLEADKGGDNISRGCLKSKTRESILLMGYAAVSKASTQKDFGTCISSIKDWVTSRRCQFFRSATPFC
jgi:hypothetical protein